MREALLHELEGDLSPEALRRLDDGFSRLKLDLAVEPAALAAEAALAEKRGEPPGPVVRAFLRYEAALALRGALDFDDLVRGALAALETDTELRARWRERCAALLVDEVQDVDRSQLRLALYLAAPDNRIFLVGDDDQTIYAWRLADVRRCVPGIRCAQAPDGWESRRPCASAFFPPPGGPIRESGTERSTNAHCRSARRQAPRGRRGGAPAFHRRRWDEPLEPPKSSVCLRCHHDVPYLVYRSPDWVCAGCAEARLWVTAIPNRSPRPLKLLRLSPPSYTPSLAEAVAGGPHARGRSRVPGSRLGRARRARNPSGAHGCGRSLVARAARRMLAYRRPGPHRVEAFVAETVTTLGGSRPPTAGPRDGPTTSASSAPSRAPLAALAHRHEPLGPLGLPARQALEGREYGLPSLAPLAHARKCGLGLSGSAGGAATFGVPVPASRAARRCRSRSRARSTLAAVPVGLVAGLLLHAHATHPTTPGGASWSAGWRRGRPRSGGEGGASEYSGRGGSGAQKRWRRKRSVQQHLLEISHDNRAQDGRHHVYEEHRDRQSDHDLDYDPAQLAGHGAPGA